MVKKYVSILLMAVYMLSTTQLAELMKMPVLIEHFMEHREQDEHMSIFNFLYMHYANGDVRDADYDKDMKLPFKSGTYPVNSIVLNYTQFPELQFAQHFTYWESRQRLSYNHSFYISHFLSNIWQPPKAC